MAINKVDRFSSLSKIQDQQYQQALVKEQQLRLRVESMAASITKVRDYQKDYQKDLTVLQTIASSSETMLRTRKFLQQLMQMEVDQLRQQQELSQKLQDAQAQTVLMLQKLRMTQKLTAKAQIEHLAVTNALETKQMDAVAAQMYTGG